MAKQLQLRRGTTSQHSTFTGANGEVTIDTDKKVVVVHDGATAGGIPLAKQATVDTKVDKITSTDNAVVRFNGVTGNVQNSSVIIGDNNYMYFGNGTSIAADTTSLQLNAADATGKITFIAAGSERMRIDTSGNVGIGTSSPSGASGKTLVINGGSGQARFALKNDSTGDASGDGLQIVLDTTSGGIEMRENLPLYFTTNNTERMRIDTSGNLLLTSGTGGLGYGTGAGGTVTQLTSKSTAVILNKPSGTIYTHNESLAAGASVTFQVFNSQVSVGSLVFVCMSNESGADVYSVESRWISNNSFYITLTNKISYAISGSLSIKFAIIKGANA